MFLRDCEDCECFVNLARIDPATGEKVWERYINTHEENLSGTKGVAVKPIPGSDDVMFCYMYENLSGQPQVVVERIDHGGVRVWKGVVETLPRIKLGDLAGLSSERFFDVDADGDLIFKSTDNSIYKVDGEDGSPLWGPVFLDADPTLAALNIVSVLGTSIAAIGVGVIRVLDGSDGSVLSEVIDLDINSQAANQCVALPNGNLVVGQWSLGSFGLGISIVSLSGDLVSYFLAPSLPTLPNVAIGVLGDEFVIGDGDLWSTQANPLLPFTDKLLATYPLAPLTITGWRERKYVYGGKDTTDGIQHLVMFDFDADPDFTVPLWATRLGSADWEPVSDAFGVVDTCVSAESGYLYACLRNRAVR